MCCTVRWPAVKIKRSENTKEYKNGSYQHLNTPPGALTGPGARGSLHLFQISKNRFLHNLLGSFCVFIPHRPTKILVEPTAFKLLIIKEVAWRALASLLITERGICGNRAGKCAAAGATLATSLRFSLGERAKKIPTDKGWDFEYWWQFEI